MKKIVCPRCGVVNLEKFVTFPNCAGCSARLSHGRAPASAPIWRRPLRSGFWMSLVGLALASAVAFSFSAHEPDAPGQLVIYAQFPRQTRLGEVLVCRLGLEPVGVEGRVVSTLRDVSWRLARSSERDWRVLSVSPAPDAPALSAARAPWRYKTWDPEERWTVRIQSRTRGRRTLAIVAGASEHFPVPWRAVVNVR